MSTVSSSPAALMLSEEAQDLICFHVHSFKNTDAMNTLYSLALTSKAFLESAQHALYKAPLRALLARPTWSRAEALLLTLQTRPGLAPHIRQLYGLEPVASAIALQRKADAVPERADDIVEFVGTLSLAEDSTAEDSTAEESTAEDSKDAAEDSRDAACDWALKLARIATGTLSLSSPMRSKAHAQSWATLVPSLSRVSSLRISGNSPFVVDFQTFESWAMEWSGRKLKKLSLFGLGWTEGATKASKFRLPFSAHELLIEEVRLTAPQLLRCLPQTLNTLKSLTISSYGQGLGAVAERGSSANFETLFKLVGKRLRTFSFSALHQYEVHGDIEEYGFGHYGPALPLAAFQAFPVVTSLTLRYLADMTPTILAALAQASPRIKILDLKWTLWSGLELDGMEDPLIAALDSFPRLKRLDLGYFPVIEEDPWEIECIMEWADEKGVDLEWQGCDYPDDEDYDSEEYFGGYDSDAFCYDSECDGDCGYLHEWELE
ncbi:hypothetical protein BCR35DRAFT_349736 [Leucosporidium creatinivorum]|uniref:F-box domain-containing protein n=1 Tax=Leucosporidium creatinivorum TaxID=106004 RepID=A0A1Y2G1P9_9BASI|nr:hypothetical protein BCR35DRAFT_349736 [Leucosporidium creatinivorum]